MDYKEKVIALLYSKELSQEQKEKLEEIFHELVESEDERIKKDIKQHFLHLDDSFPDKAKWLTWLEKQGNTNF